MISVIITICYVAAGGVQCVPVERAAAGTLAECQAHERAIELAVVLNLLAQGFPFPLDSVTADCSEGA